MIRVLVVDDSLLFRTAFSAVLQRDPEIEVVATAKDGREAVALVQQHRPDLVTMDVNMPEMNGYEAVEQIMAVHPTPIVLVTGSPSKRSRQAVMKALALGALEVVAKPDLSRSEQAAASVAELIETIKTLSTAHVVRHVGWLRKSRQRARAARRAFGTRLWSAVAIASSTGGPAALAELLAALPDDLAAAVVVAQHLADGFTQTLVEWLGSVSSLPVREARPGERLEPGTVTVAPSNRHMKVDCEGRVRLVEGPALGGARPSADLLLSSVSEAFGAQAVGIVLTGMGRDGTEGLRAIRSRGGHTIAQDESSSVVFGMPRAAIEAQVVDQVLPLEKIPEAVVTLVGRRVVDDSPSPRP